MSSHSSEDDCAGSTRSGSNSSYDRSASGNSSTTDENSSRTGSISSGGDGTNAAAFRDQLGNKENVAVRRSKLLMVLIIVLSATAAGVATYMFTRKEERRDLSVDFLESCREISTVSQRNAGNIYEVIQSLGNVATSLSLTMSATADQEGVNNKTSSHKKVWPYFTFPDYYVHFEHALEESGADLIALSPIIQPNGKQQWERFVESNYQDWLSYSAITVDEDEFYPNHPTNTTSDVGSTSSSFVPMPIHPIEDEDEVDVHEVHKVFTPIWQMLPAYPSILNFDISTDEDIDDLLEFMYQTNEPTISRMIDIPTLLFQDQQHDGATAMLDDSPRSLMLQPIFEGFTNVEQHGGSDAHGGHDGHALGGNPHAKGSIVAYLTAVLPWNVFFSNILYEGAKGVILVLENTCGDIVTYEIEGPRAHYLGEGDLHDPQYDGQGLEFHSDFEPFSWHTDEDDNSDVNCHYYMYMYPSQELVDEYNTTKPIIYTIAMMSVFVITGLTFLLYDFLVQKRQTVVMETAVRSNAIVSSLFPAEVRDRLFQSKKHKKKKQRELERARKQNKLLPTFTEAPKFRLNNFLNDDEAAVMKEIESKPIADLFLHTTVMFGDISGFTAWSSTREPTQVFTLLETVYRAFDHIAKRRNVFKVETIGDCYVAVVGLPVPRDDHATAMARFARECLQKFLNVTQTLEQTLGPDTSDLGMRFGLHSGPVTAGVLRGEKSRFQLFGDTVNTAARMESNGMTNRIQISQETATLLIADGKEEWIKPRETKVVAKGKGELQTYWLFPKGQSSNIEDETQSPTLSAKKSIRGIPNGNAEVAGNQPQKSQKLGDVVVPPKIDRMIRWNVELLQSLLKKVIAARRAKEDHVKDAHGVSRLEETVGFEAPLLDEVDEFIALPEFDKNAASIVEDPDSIQLDPEVTSQIRKFITVIATMYHDNNFHNFEHASHVTMSVSKLLSRIVDPNVGPSDKSNDQVQVLSSMHDRTYGITSDPLTQFAVVFSALIHDVDHRGVPNFALVKEDQDLAAAYNSKSVAEQNSIDRAWERLMEPDFDLLRSCIYTNKQEFQRFRKLVVNTVLATDIFDKDFGELRRNRWQRCFHKDLAPVAAPHPDDIHRKATIVIEHIIQASDVAHTMQHWQIYTKWNERLFREMYQAYRSGRLDKDPSVNWFQGEIGFFDGYIIPLAKKLKECGVFGVSSDEYLNYAMENRKEWSVRGEKIVEKMKESVLLEYP